MNNVSSSKIHTIYSTFNDVIFPPENSVVDSNRGLTSCHLLLCCLSLSLLTVVLRSDNVGDIQWRESPLPRNWSTHSHAESGERETHASALQRRLQPGNVSIVCIIIPQWLVLSTIGNGEDQLLGVVAQCVDFQSQRLSSTIVLSLLALFISTIHLPGEFQTFLSLSVFYAAMV